MIVGATVFAVLILLVLLSERGSGMLWRGPTGEAFYYCTPCDLRYPLAELRDPGDRICPRGHFVEPVPRGFPFNTFFICLCAAFIATGGVLILTGAAPTP